VSYRPAPTAPATAGTTSTRDGDDWRYRAACLDEDPELWFPIGNTGPALIQIDNAKAACARCEVQDTCLRWALETGQDYGVWGGMSEDERRALKRRRARQGRSTPTAPTESKPPQKPPKKDPTTRPSCGRQRGHEAHTNAGERQCDACTAWRKRGRVEAA
jgi:WhiB family redox-sensing transcriptional regulator